MTSTRRSSQAADMRETVPQLVDALMRTWKDWAANPQLYLEIHAPRIARSDDLCCYCEMPILRVRRAQRFHRGCGPPARQRASRARRRLAHEAS